MAKIDFLIVCDHAESTNGKVNMLGGGFSHVFRLVPHPAIPGQPVGPPPPNHFAVALSVLVGWNETDDPVSLRLTLEDDDNHVLHAMGGQFQTGRPAGATKGAPIRATLAFPINITFPTTGGHCVRAVVTDAEGQTEERVATFAVLDQFVMPPFVQAEPPSGPPAPPPAGA